MALTASCEYEEAQQYRGKLLKTKYNGKKQIAYLNLVCDDFNIKEAIAFAKANSCVLMVEYQGSDMCDIYNNLKESDTAGVHMFKTYELGTNITDEDVETVIEKTPDGVVPVIVLPSEFKDIHLIYNLSAKYPDVRFAGGELFPLDGCNVGRYSIDLAKSRGIKVTDSDSQWSGTDVFLDVSLSDLTVELVDKQEKTFSSGTRKSSGGGSNGGGTKKKLFSDMLASVGDTFDL